MTTMGLIRVFTELAVPDLLQRYSDRALPAVAQRGSRVLAPLRPSRGRRDRHRHAALVGMIRATCWG